MAEKSTTKKAAGDLASRVTTLEGRVAALEKLVSRASKKAIRRKREYTDEERAAIRVRLLVGQEAAQKKREAEAKAVKKVKTGNSDTVKAVETEKPAKA